MEPFGILVSLPQRGSLVSILPELVDYFLLFPAFFGSLLLPVLSQRRVDAAILESAQLFQAFMDHLPGFAWIKDANGQYLYVNSNLAQLPPYRSGWLGKTDAELWPPELAASYQHNDRTVIATGRKLETIESYFVGEDEHHVLVNKFPIFNSDGAVAMVGGACVDITRRRHAEKRLRETEEKYRSIFENAIEGIFQTTPNGRFVAANPALARMLGFDSPEELMRMRTDIAQEHYVDPQSREEFKRALAENGFVRDFELEAYRKDGSRIWISENVCAVRDDSGTLVYYEGTTQDITARRQAEEALHESEERYRDLVENSQDLICTHDLNGLILSANRAAMKLMGYGPGNYWGGINFREILAPEVRDQFDEYLNRIRTDGVASGLMLVQTKSGEKRVWEYQNTLRTDGVAEPIVRGVARDITERRRASHSLRLFRALIDRSRDAIEVSDPDTLRFLDCNESAYKDLGYTREEFLSLNVCDVNPWFDERMATPLNEEMHQAGFVIFESIRRRKDGSTFPVEINLKIVRLERDYRVAVVRDITERKRGEAALRDYARKLIDAQETERQNIASELHDQTGQVLTAIRINLQTLRQTCKTAESKSLVDEGVGMVDQALEQVRDLSFELRPTILDDLGLSAALRWYTERYAQRTGIRIKLETNLPAGRIRLRPELETACFRIVQEALTNVARHSRAKNLSINLGTSNHEIVLAIKDDGCGFDMQSLDKGVAGMSLGIRAMKERALALGRPAGNLICSIARYGDLRLFVKPRANSALMRITIGSPMVGGMVNVKPTSVLLADDHALVRAGVRALLERIEQVEVVAEAGDGQQTLELMQQLNPDVVLLDLTMPGLGGFDILKLAGEKFPHVLIIVLTVHDSEEYALHALRLGAAGYLPKSAASAELELAIRHVSSGKKYLSPSIEQKAALELTETHPGQPASAELTPRQKEVLTLIAEGCSTKNIARVLCISVKTVETHRAQLMDRLNIHDIAGLVRYAIKIGLVSIEQREPIKTTGGGA